MKKINLTLIPVALLALAGCDKNETNNEISAEGNKVAMTPADLPPPITSSKTYRCKDNTILYVDIFGEMQGAAVRISDKNSAAIRADLPKAEAAETDAQGNNVAAPATPQGTLVSSDGELTVSGEAGNLTVKLPGKSAQSCKA
ncbi:hypothetical protein LPB140_01375 [Sphingorhabdus lutea]|uniref:C-type lysozyme inhibitor domain-containing protein n=1 Tax=Sphingorhabdus lutea TaxID=1913578 RepID=A0A1L3J9A4_9SPHN|nr:hypothetical protein [Sphingorhabdus lutea]APG61709.1 hypothetical protein LPB140_01375 [Sphingorhabdus lutea]